MYQPERRKSRRLAYGAEIDYAVTAKTPSGLVSTDSRNLSAGGVCIIAFEQFSLGDIVTLRIALPKFGMLKMHPKRQVQTKGRVIWVNTLRIGAARTRIAYEAGIEFFDLKAADRAAIHQFTQGAPPS